MTIAILILAVLVLIDTVWALDQRAKRRTAEDDATIARLRADVLADQVPFPRGERLP
jgi:hypothetical protein